MTNIFVPPKVAAELREESRRHSGELRDCILIDEKWTEILQEIDPNLYMVRTRDWVRAGLPLVPGGYYHIIRDNSDRSAPETVIPIQGPEGEFMEPTSGHLEMLRRNDLQRPGAMRELKERDERLRKQQEKLRQSEREERQAEIMERYLAGSRTFISMDRSTPWTQSARGRKAK